MAAGTKRAVGWQTCLLNRLALPLLAAIMLAGFGLRVLRLDYQALWLDELYSLWVASFPLNQIGHVMATDPVFISDVPGYYAVLAVWIRVAGGSEFAVRYVSVMCGMLCLPLFYRLLRMRLGNAVSVVGAAILAVSAFHIYYSQEARMHMLAALLCLAAVYALLHGLVRNRAGDWLAYAALATASLYTFYYSALVLIAVSIGAAFCVRRAFGRWLAASGLVVLAFVPWLWVVKDRFAQLLAHRLSDFAPLSAMDYLRQSTSPMVFGPTIDSRLMLPAALLLLAAALISGWRLLRNTSPWDIVTPAYAVLTVAGMALLALRIPVFYPRYLLASLPGWIALAVAGWPVVPRARWLLPAFGTALFLWPTGVSLANNYANPAYERIDYTPAMEVIRQQALSNEAIVFDSPNPDSKGGHFLYDQPLPAIPLPVPGDQPGTEARLALASQRYGGLWVLLYGQLDIDRENWVENWLDSHELPVLDRSFGDNWYRLKHYRPAPKLLAEASLSGGFASDAHLGPLHLLQTRVPAVAPELTVDLLWTTDRAVDVNYVVSVQLLAEDKRKAAQLDSEPFLGGYPTSEWKPGLAYADAIQIKPGVLPPGTYTLQVGAYPAGKPELAQQVELGRYAITGGPTKVPFQPAAS